MPKFDRFFSAFLPERALFRQKDSRACRELLEEVALLEPERRRVIACRGERFARELPDSCFDAPLARRLLPDGEGAFLLFPELFEDTGLIFALFFPTRAGELSASLALIGRRDFVGCSPDGTPNADLACLLEEILFYLDGLFSATANLPLWTLLLRAANFAGCRLRRVDLPARSCKVSPADAPVTLAFLLCFFLTVRKGGGEAEAEAEEASPRYRVRLVALSRAPDDGTALSVFPTCEAFRNFSCFLQDGKPTVLLPILTDDFRVSAADGSYACLLLQCTREAVSPAPLRTRGRRFFGRIPKRKT